MQNIIVFIIGILVFGYVGWKVFKSITRKPSPADRCAGCTGCALKDEINCIH